MKKAIFISLFLITGNLVSCQTRGEIKLLIRGDDIGSSHTANVACIESYKNGIMRSVELMVPGPWFPEAVRMLNENPGLDVGVHLVITSEWNDIKWRPLTCCPSLVDKDGYFYPMIWQREDFPKGTALKDAPWKIEEIEKEFRAQIEMAKRHIPHVSHVNCHMGCGSCAHPGLDTPEMRAIWHTGYENVAADRDAVTKVFTSSEVKKAISEKGIVLTSYKDSHN